MNNVTGFKDPRIAAKLKQQAQLHEPKFTENLEIPKIHFGDLRCYIVETKTAISPAIEDPIKIGDTVGKGEAWLAQRNPDDDKLEYWFPSPNNRVKVDIFNLTTTTYYPGTILLVIQDRDGDLWIIPMGKSGLIIAEALECFYPKDVDKQAKIYRLNSCVWEVTQEIGLISDPLDANMLTIGDKVFVQERAGCTDQSGKKRYDIVGSFGLFRWAKANADIGCGSFGTVTIWKKGDGTTDPPTQQNCGGSTATWIRQPSGWIQIVACPIGCRSEQDPNDLIFPTVTPLPPFTSPCIPDGTQPPPQSSSCDLVTTGCQVDACNSWGSRRCIKQSEKLHIHYLGRGVWDILPFQRNKNYFAFLAQDMCTTGTFNISSPQPQDFCMSAEEIALVTNANNIMNLPGELGDVVKVEEDLTSCGGLRYITQVYHKCKKIPVASCQGSGQYLTYDPLTCQIISTVQEIHIPFCKPPVLVTQLQLTEYYLINDLELYKDPQYDCTIHLDGNVVRLCAFPNMMGPTQSDPADFGTISFETVDAIVNPYLDLVYDPESQTGSGQLGEGCENAKLYLKGDSYPVIKCGPKKDYTSQPLIPEIQDFVVDVDLSQCPKITYATAIVLKANCETMEEEADCTDCEDSGTGTGQ